MSIRLEVTREVILDLAPLYLSGEASPETRALVDAFVVQDPELAEWFREQQITLFSTLDGAPAAETKLASLRRTRRRLSAQRWCFGLGWFFVALSLTTEFKTYRGRIVEYHLVARDYPLAAATCLMLVAVCWTIYAVLRRRALVVLIGALAAGALLAMPQSSRAQRTNAEHVQEFRIDAGHSDVAFEIPFAYSRVRGRFDDVSGWVLLGDPTSGGIATSQVAAVIRTPSINTGSKHRDEHLRTVDFLDTERFPVMTFHSDHVETNGDSLIIVGPLMLHGQTRIVRIPGRLTLPPTRDPHHNMVALVTGRTALALRDFDITGGDSRNPWFDRIRRATMGDSVRVTLEIQLWRPDVQNPDSVTRRTIARIDTLGIDSSVTLLRGAFTRDSSAFAAAEYSLDLVGQQLLDRGRVREGFLWLHAIARLLPGSRNAMVSVGVANELSGDRERALTWYQRALASDSYDPRALLRVQHLMRVDGAAESRRGRGGNAADVRSRN